MLVRSSRGSAKTLSSDKANVQIPVEAPEGNFGLQHLPCIPQLNRCLTHATHFHRLGGRQKLRQRTQHGGRPPRAFGKYTITLDKCDSTMRPPECDRTVLAIQLTPYGGVFGSFSSCCPLWRCGDGVCAVSGTAKVDHPKRLDLPSTENNKWVERGVYTHPLSTLHSLYTCTLRASWTSRPLQEAHQQSVKEHVWTV